VSPSPIKLPVRLGPLFVVAKTPLRLTILFYQRAMANEADTFRACVVPKLPTAGWDNESHSIAEQRTFTDGHIVIKAKCGRAVLACTNGSRLSGEENNFLKCKP
jgi:hypothetical protein